MTESAHVDLIERSFAHGLLSERYLAKEIQGTRRRASFERMNHAPIGAGSAKIDPGSSRWRSHRARRLNLPALLYVLV